MLSAIYASRNPIYRLDLCNYLNNLGLVVEIPQLLIGDFNQILWSDEKKGGTPFSRSHAQPFVDVVNNCGLCDLGFSGPKFTWSNMRNGLDNVQERLD